MDDSSHLWCGNLKLKFEMGNYITVLVGRFYVHRISYPVIYQAFAKPIVLTMYGLCSMVALGVTSPPLNKLPYTTVTPVYLIIQNLIC